MMTLKKQTDEITLACLLDGLANIDAEDNRSIVNVKIDSRNVQIGDLFLACQGFRSNGSEYIDDAISAGACAVAVDADLIYRGNDCAVPVIAVADLSARAGLIAHRFYQCPSDSLNVIGITGTNGKTSIAHFIAQAFSAASGIEAGIIGTLGIGTPGKMQQGKNTTPDPLTIHQALAAMRDEGVENVLMEVSSHALVQARVAGVSFDSAIFTNLSREHLDYHGDMETYAEAKRQLFLTRSLKHAVINTDDEYGQRLHSELAGRLRVISYGIGVQPTNEKADEHVAGIITDPGVGSLSMDVLSPWGEGTLKTRLTGEFNASNLLASLSALCLSGMRFKDALKWLANVAAIPGRMECFTKAGFARVIVDYAHTPDALEKALSSLQIPCKGRLVCVLGCGGDRDQGKRPLMGKIAEKYCDRIILTNDNPRNEDPEAIISQISAAIAKKDPVTVLPDRAAAIKAAINSSYSNDIILVAGKGHETYQEIAGVRLPFSDRQLVRNLLGQTE